MNYPQAPWLHVWNRLCTAAASSSHDRSCGRFSKVVSILSVAALFAGTPATSAAQAPATGTIEGRVLNVASGQYLNNARVSIKGTSFVTLTDDSGRFRLTDIPAGEVTLRVFFTGLDEKEASVTVEAGKSVEHDFRLTNKARYGSESDVVKLDAFVVQAAKETNAAAIAVNEQRVAFGQKSVISADQFGTIPDSNPGELMKWLPGVSVEYFANNIVGVSVRGLDAANTEIRFDGMPMASASTATASTPGRDRNFEMLGSSSADIARVEIRKLRTPEDSANALGGSINLIRRSAFEADRRRFTYNALFTSDAESFSFGKRAGIRDTRIEGWRPNFKLTWTDPVSKTFGYAITLSHNDVLARVHWSAPSVNFGTIAQANAAKARLDAGKPLTTASVYNPVTTQDLLHDNPKQDITDALSVKFDWKPVPDLKLSYTLSASRYQERTGDDLRFTWNTGNQSNSNLDAVLGTPGTNGEHATYGNLGAGSIRYDMREAWRNGIKPILTNVIESEWRHGDWTLSGAGSYSTSKHTFRDTDDGFFQSTTMSGSSLPNTGIGTGSANPTKITVDLLDRDFKIAHTVKAYAFNTGDTAVGPEVDWQNLNNMYIGGAVSRPARTYETIGAIRVYAKRDFRVGDNPLAIRAGFDFDEQFRNVQSYDAKLWTFVGADHKASTADDSAAQIAQVNVQPERDHYFDSPAVTRLSLRRLYDLYKTHPDWFEYRDAESYKFSVREPYQIEERTYAPYLELTGSLLHNRLTYVGGVRYEKVTTWGLGYRDNGSKYVQSLGLVDGSYEGNLARYVRNGVSGAGSNDGYFPSLEVNYNITDNIIARFGYARTQAKNRFSRSVIPSSTFDYNAVTSGTYAGIAQGTVTLANPNLLPWTADNYEAHLEYYTSDGGVFSVGGFLKEIQNVQVNSTTLLDSTALLQTLDLDSGFLNWQAKSWYNGGDGEISGLEFEMRQSLDRWVPDFARGFTLTGSFNYNHLSKFVFLSGGKNINPSSDFQNFYETQDKLSIGYHRGRLGATIGVIRNGKVYRQRQDITDSLGNDIPGNRYYPHYTTVDFSLEYAVSRWAKLFVSGRNITDAQKIRYRQLEGAPDWSLFQISNNLGVTYTAGVSGSF